VSHPPRGIPLFRGAVSDSKNDRPQRMVEWPCVYVYKSLTTTNYSQSEGEQLFTTETMTFLDQNPSYTYAVDSNIDGTFGTSDMDDADLDKFFARPIKVHEAEWSTSVVFYEDINPWTLFFSNPRVCNRINNYNLLRAKLHVKFMLNGNGFYYGRLLANYKPLPALDDMIRDRALIPQDNIAASQRPHVYLDPSTSQGGQLDLPFFWYFNALSVPTSSWDLMGNVSIRQLTPLKHANGSTDPVTVSVFVWATDVELSVPTAADSNQLTAQMGYEKPKKNKKAKVTLTKNKPKPQVADEYGDGIVSKPAATVARIAGMLKQAPIIGPYARATEIAASGISNIAKLFGYSRPATVSPMTLFAPRYMSDLATTNIADTITKLTLDGKQELSVDGSTVGLSSNDEMTVLSVSTRESYLTSFSWPMLTAPETLLWSSEVSPVLWDDFSGEIHMPACCFAALPFYHWRGSMKFRFQVVASAFHRGRLKIVYEPYQMGAQTEYNINYMHIVDISEDKDFTVEIGWGSPYPYLRHKSPGVSVTPFQSGPVPLTGPAQDLCNGYLYVSIVNELTSPNATVNNDVSVNVFVSTGDDFEVKNPSEDLIKNLTLFQAQSGFENQVGDETVVQTDKDCTTEPSKPIQDSVLGSMAAPLDLTDPATRVFYGEEITSFRQCLKRYNYFQYFPLNSDATATGVQHVRYTLNSYPFNRGEAGVNSAFGTTNYCKNTLFNYIGSAYMGWRGGMRWKFLTALGDHAGELRAQRLNTLAPINTYTQTAVDVTTATVAEAMRNVTEMYDTLWAGGAATPTSNQSVLEVEIPYHNNHRFAIARELNYASSQSDPTFNPFAIDYIGSFANADRGNGLQAYVAAGEDFSYFFFVGAPVMFVQSTLP